MFETTISGTPLGAEVLTVMRGLAVESFRRLNPRAPKAAAWRFAEAHAEEFREQAIDALALLYARREAEQVGRERIN